MLLKQDPMVCALSNCLRITFCMYRQDICRWVEVLASTAEILNCLSNPVVLCAVCYSFEIFRQIHQRIVAVPVWKSIRGSYIRYFSETLYHSKTNWSADNISSIKPVHNSYTKSTMIIYVENKMWFIHVFQLILIEYSIYKQHFQKTQVKRYLLLNICSPRSRTFQTSRLIPDNNFQAI